MRESAFLSFEDGVTSAVATVIRQNEERNLKVKWNHVLKRLYMIYKGVFYFKIRTEGKKYVLFEIAQRHCGGKT